MICLHLNSLQGDLVVADLSTVGYLFVTDLFTGDLLVTEFPILCLVSSYRVICL